MSSVLARFAAAAPRRTSRPDDYKRQFPRSGRVFLRFLRRSDMLPVSSPSDRPAVGVVVAPWVSTMVPWYAVMLGIGLARRGRRIVIFWDDTGFPEEFLDEQLETIGRVLSYVGQWFDVVRLTDLAPAKPREGDEHRIEVLSRLNVTWRLRGGAPGPHDLPFAAEVSASLTRSLSRIRAAVEQSGAAFLVVPGGVYGASGLFRLAGADAGIRVATYDADLNVAQICVDGVASQCGDIPRAFDELWDEGPSARERARSKGEREFLERTEQRDQYGFQAAPALRVPPPSDGSALIPLNVEWDTSALGKHLHFDDTRQWLAETISMILRETASPIVVRQHPSERRAAQTGRNDIASFLKREFGNEPRVRFVAASDAVNTYDLVRSAQLVLPFVSTIGIEAAALGKPVIVGGRAYYEGLGFVRAARSREEYFTLIQQGLTVGLEALPDQSERAWVCYYLTAVAYRVRTDFTPQPDDFWRWSERPSVLEEPAVHDILQALDTDVPIALVRDRRDRGLADR